MGFMGSIFKLWMFYGIYEFYGFYGYGELPAIAKNSSVTVFSDDTDIVYLPLHHIVMNPSLKEILLVDMTKKKGLQRECYSV